MIDPLTDFEDLMPRDVDAHIERIRQLSVDGKVGGEDAAGVWEMLAMRIARSGGDVDDFIDKLQALQI